MTKPVLIGLHNPYSTDPVHALAPFPDGSAGHRLYSMLNDVRPIPMAVYREAFLRFNLCSFATNDPVIQRTYADGLAALLPMRSTVFLLGKDVLRAFTSDERPLEPILIHPQVHGGITWRWLPHPSGRSTSYNDPAMKHLAGMALADALVQSQGG